MTDKTRFRAVYPSALVSKLIVPFLATTRPKIGLGSFSILVYLAGARTGYCVGGCHYRHKDDAHQ
jgi:hypothetical protein